MLEVIETNRCCGCAACVNACPKKAISIVQDENGFYKHHIDQKLCVNCGLCQKVCPLLNFASKNYEVPSCYAVMADDELRAKSSSGGAFGIIAHEILNLNGVVCGAAFDDEWHVKHIIVDNVNDLQKLHGSKYVQSYISADLFQQIKKYLDEDRYVLFTGVPCQVAGLRNFLRKEYEKLYTADLICAYAPSPKVFDAYLSENYDKKKIDKINFRDKTMFGWSCTVVVVDVGSDRILDYKYMTPYLNRMFKGEHCVNCAYKKFPRPGDFTIGDFWKIHEFTKDMDDRKGTSALVLNSAKAEKLFETFRHKFKKIKNVSYNGVKWQFDATAREGRTTESLLFYKNLSKLPFQNNVIKARKQNKVAVINWWYINNRGAILTNYALNEMVKSLGYHVETINFVYPTERHKFFNGFAEDFAKKYLLRTRWLDNTNDLKSINSEFDTFICGSDQIFRYFCAQGNGNIHYMGWVDAKNKLLSYAASFAVNEFQATTFQTNLVKHWLKRFDKHSIREFDGVDIMKNTFGLEATQVLDPVFCIDKQKYIDIAEKSTDKIQEDFIAYYIMWPTDKNKKIIDYVKDKLGVKIAIHLNPPMSIENWLWYIQHAKFVITDSFHPACFSLIFNKQFAAIPNPAEYPSRFLSLDKISGLSSRFFYDNARIYSSTDLFEPINWETCNQNIQKYINASISWLKNALEEDKVYKLTEEQEVIDALLNRQDEENLKLSIRIFNLENELREISIAKDNVQINPVNKSLEEENQRLNAKISDLENQLKGSVVLKGDEIMNHVNRSLEEENQRLNAKILNLENQMKESVILKSNEIMNHVNNSMKELKISYDSSRRIMLPKWFGNIVCGFILKKKNRHRFRKNHIRHS